MKISRFLIGFLMIFLTSCDPFTGSFVANSSNEKTTVIIKYNQNNQSIKKYIQTHKSFEKFVKFIHGYSGSKGDLVGIDTTKYIATFELNKKDTLEIWGGIRQSNDFDEIEEVIVYPNKIETTIKGQDIEDVFLKKSFGFYIYTVK